MQMRKFFPLNARSLARLLGPELFLPLHEALELVLSDRLAHVLERGLEVRLLGYKSAPR